MWLNALTIVLDLLWIITMRSVWASKPQKNAGAWNAFSRIRGLTVFLSLVNVGLKGIAFAVLFQIRKAGQSAAKPLTTR